MQGYHIDTMQICFLSLKSLTKILDSKLSYDYDSNYISMPSDMHIVIKAKSAFIYVHVICSCKQTKILIFCISFYHESKKHWSSLSMRTKSLTKHDNTWKQYKWGRDLTKYVIHIVYWAEHILIKLKTKYFYHMFVYIWESKSFRWQEKYFDVRFDNTWCACIQDKVLIIGNENEN